MNRKRWIGIAVLLAVLVLLGWAFIEGRKGANLEAERERPVNAPSRVQVIEGEVVVAVDEATRRRSGIVVAALESSDQQGKIRAFGVVVDPLDLLDVVRRYAAAKADATRAEAALAATRAEHDRLAPLHDARRNVSDKTFQEAEAAWRADEADATAARTVLHAQKDAVGQRYGAVIASWVFGASGRFQRLARQQDLLLQVTVPAGTTLEPAPPKALVEAPDGGLVEASLVSPSPRTDPRVQGASFFYLLPARGSGLLPGMTFTAWLPVGETVAGVVIPAQAAVWWQGRPWVYVESGPDHFARREVPTDTPTSDGWFVTRSLSAGDRIVATGGQQLLSEEFRAQIQVGEDAAGK